MKLKIGESGKLLESIRQESASIADGDVLNGIVKDPDSEKAKMDYVGKVLKK